METKTPVLLVVLVDVTRLRWLVGAIGLDGIVTPLLRSEDGDIALYQGLPLDEQVSFLRHRFCGVLQRGCDRLWPVGKKACQFAFVFENLLPGATEELTLQVSEHFAAWMLNPPVVVFVSHGGFNHTASPTLSRLAGTIERPVEEILQAGLAPLFALVADSGAWEVSQRKATWQPSTASGDCN